jgi:formylglycine-generating enzyme
MPTILWLCLSWVLCTPCGWTQPASRTAGGTKEEALRQLERDLVLVEGGAFVPGCMKACDCPNEHGDTMALQDFLIGKYEVTHAQWRAVMGKPSRSARGCDQCPVDGISWNDIQDFLVVLQENTGKPFRLPTEAEWEYAARGGRQSMGFCYSGGNDPKEVAWYAGNCSSVREVGLKRPNELGLYDMTGNLWEYCSDRYFPYWWDGGGWLMQEGQETEPQASGEGEQRVVRGGYWELPAEELTLPSARWSYHADERYGLAGFRLALSPEQ